MATIVLTDAFVSWDGNDFSDHVQSVSLSYNAETVDDTAMGDDTRSRKGGLKDWSADITFFQDEASSSIAQTLFPDVGTTATLLVRPDNSDGVSATNPNYSGTGILESFDLVSGSVGEMHTTQVRIQAAGSLSRATS